MVLMSTFKIVQCSYVVKQHCSPCHLPVSFHTSLSVNQFHSLEQLLHISLSFLSPLTVRSVLSLVSAASLPRPTQTSQQNILMAWQVRLSLPGFDFFSSPCICPLIWKAAVKIFTVLLLSSFSSPGKTAPMTPVNFMKNFFGLHSERK